jgi:hypothetical protein
LSPGGIPVETGDLPGDAANSPVILAELTGYQGKLPADSVNSPGETGNSDAGNSMSPFRFRSPASPPFHFYETSRAFGAS